MDISIRKCTKAELIEIYRNSDKTVKRAPYKPSAVVMTIFASKEEEAEFRRQVQHDIDNGVVPF